MWVATQTGNDAHLQQLVDQLASETGVPRDDVARIVERLGLVKSLSGLRSLVGDQRTQVVSAEDLVLGIMYDKHMIIK